MKKKSVVFGVGAAIFSAAFWACGSGEVITYDQDLEGTAEFNLGNISDAEVAKAIADCLADTLGCAIEMRNAGPLPTSADGSAQSSSRTQNPTSSNQGPRSSMIQQSSMTFVNQSSSSPTFASSGGTVLQSSSSVYIGPGAEYGSCAPETNPINHGGGTVWKMTKNPSVEGQVIVNASYSWAFDGGATPATSTARGKTNTETIVYATSGVKNATLTFTPPGGTPVAIQCAPLQVNGAAITGCKCAAAASSVDVALGQSASWTVSGCTSRGATITGYTWGGAGVTGSGTTAVGAVAAKGDVVQASVIVENDDNTKQTVTCPAVKAIDSNLPDYEIKVSQGTVTLPAAGEYTVVVSSGGNITQCRMSAQSQQQASITVNSKTYRGQHYIPFGTSGVVDNSWCNSSLSVTTTAPITLQASWN